jgi:hypothetical protein
MNNLSSPLNRKEFAKLYRFLFPTSRKHPGSHRQALDADPDPQECTHAKIKKIKIKFTGQKIKGYNPPESFFQRTDL